MLTTERYDICVLEFDATSRQIVTRAKGCVEVRVCMRACGSRLKVDVTLADVITQLHLVVLSGSNRATT